MSLETRLKELSEIADWTADDAKEWDAIKKAQAAAIDPDTCEIDPCAWVYAADNPLPWVEGLGFCHGGHTFIRLKGGGDLDWVYVSDIPEATRKKLWPRLKAHAAMIRKRWRIAFDAKEKVKFEQWHKQDSLRWP